MSNTIFRFEVGVWLKSPLFYLLLSGYFLFPLLSMLGTGGFFDEGALVNEQFPLLNTPYGLSNNSFLLIKLLLLAVAILAGQSLYRDYQSQMHRILYAFPIRKRHFLVGKMGSVLALLLLCCLLVLGGMLLGEQLLGVENPRIAVFYPMAYLLTWLVYIVPTVVVVATIVFVTVGLSRNIFAGFVAVICLILFPLMLENVLVNNRVLLALLDPFGEQAFLLATQDWNFEQRNSTALPISGWVWLNRIIWLLLAGLGYVFFYRRFELQEEKGVFFPVWHPVTTKSTKSALATRVIKSAPVRLHDSWLVRFRLIWYVSVFHFWSILRSWLFILIAVFGAVTVFFIQLKTSNTGAFTLLPLTRIFIGAPLSIYTLLLVLSTFLFSGILEGRERRYELDLVVDSTAVRTWQVFLSKVGAISGVQIVQLLLFLGVSILIQRMNAYTRLELGLYLYHLFCLVFPVLLVWNLTSYFMHSLFSNQLLSLSALAVLWLGVQSLEQLGIETHLLNYNTLPPLSYSDFNGYGSALAGYWLVLGYWLSWGAILSLITLLIWKRGSQTSAQERWQWAISRLKLPTVLLLILLLGTFTWLFALVYEAEKTSKELDDVAWKSALSAYREDWSPHSQLTQPKIVDIDLDIALFPEERRFEATGHYKLVNKSKLPIDTVFLRTGFDEYTELQWSVQTVLVKEADAFKNYLFKLQKPLLPNDSLQLTFRVWSSDNQLFSRNSNVLVDGTYLKHDFLPRLGYVHSVEQREPNDSLAHQHHYFHEDADYVQLRTSISTSADQVAIAPGQLICRGEWGDRVVYEYQTPFPVKINFSFHSAVYEQQFVEQEGTRIEIYYKKGHATNVEMMTAGIKAALDYHANHFDAYPYPVVRIVEFPYQEGDYSATLTANNIVASELLFNLHQEPMADRLNLPFYVMAHELTHEWFGNQLLPANAKGAKMLTESIAEYLSLCIYQDYFGEKMGDQFLELQYERYQRGKNRERLEEPALYRVGAEQEYLFYGKGAIAFHEIATSIGQENLLEILGEFLQTYKLQTAHYPTTMDFVDFLKENSDESAAKLIDQWLLERHEVGR